MAEVKIPSFFPIEVRTGTLADVPYPSKDSVSVNCFADKKGNGVSCEKRPGISLHNTPTAGKARGIAASSSADSGYIYAVSNIIYSANGFSFDTTETPTATNFGTLSSYVPPERYPASTHKLVYLINNRIYVSSGSVSLSALVTTPWNANVYMAEGLAELDGTVYAMDQNCDIWGSNVAVFNTWSALNKINAGTTADTGVFLGRYRSYIVAFCGTAVQFLYDAGNATGSPLSIVPNTFLDFGAIYGTVKKVGDTYIWLGQTADKQLKVAMLNGLSYQIVSSGAVDRILSQHWGKDNTSTAPIPYNNFTSAVVNVGEKLIYLLSIRATATSNAMTLAFDLTTKTWATWTTLSARTSGTVNLSVDADKFIVTVTHALTLNNQEFVTMAGNSVADYNGTFPITVISPTQFQYSLQKAATLNPGATSTCTAYTENAFQVFSSANNGAQTVFGGSTLEHTPVTYLQLWGGNIVSTNNQVFVDSLVSVGGATVPIPVRIRTSDENFDSVGSKFQEYVEVVGEKQAGTMYYRYTNDDYVTYSKYVGIPLLANRSRKFNGGKFNRRAWEFMYYENTDLSIDEFAASLHKGM